MVLFLLFCLFLRLNFSLFVFVRHSSFSSPLLWGRGGSEPRIFQLLKSDRPYHFALENRGGSCIFSAIVMGWVTQKQSSSYLIPPHPPPPPAPVLYDQSPNRILIIWTLFETIAVSLPPTSVVWSLEIISDKLETFSKHLNSVTWLFSREKTFNSVTCFFCCFCGCWWCCCCCRSCWCCCC